MGEHSEECDVVPLANSQVQDGVTVGAEEALSRFDFQRPLSSREEARNWL